MAEVVNWISSFMRNSRNHSLVFVKGRQRTWVSSESCELHDLHEMHNLLYFLLLLRNKDTWGVLEALGGLGVNLGLETEGMVGVLWCVCWEII